MRYRPELDGLRALAVLAVLATHTGLALTVGGWLGVDVFFVLSGFLITGLLLEEYAGRHTVSLRGFYARRALRLYPALLLLLALGAPFYAHLGGRPAGVQDATFWGYGGPAVVAATYTSDVVAGLGLAPMGELVHTWSLAVEEQFYLLWPCLLLVLLRRRLDVVRWAAGLALASFAALIALLSVSHHGGADAYYYLPVSRFWELMVGCALAALVRRGWAPAAAGRRWWAVAAVVLAAVTPLLVAVRVRGEAYPPAGGGWAMAWAAPAVVVATGAVVLHLLAAPGGALGRGLRMGPLVWLGRRSYGVYLFHLPVLALVDAYLAQRRLVDSAVMLVVTIGLAALSYRFVELPFLRLKQRFRPGDQQRSVTLALSQK